MREYTTKIEDKTIVVTRTKDGATIAFKFDEVVFGWSVLTRNCMAAKPLLQRLRREAVKLAKQQPGYVWG